MQISLLEWHGILNAWFLISALLFAVGGLGFAAASRWRRSAWLSSPFIAFLAFQLATRLIPPNGDDFSPLLVTRLWVFYIAILVSGVVSLTLPIRPRESSVVRLSL